MFCKDPVTILGFFPYLRLGKRSCCRAPGTALSPPESQPPAGKAALALHALIWRFPEFTGWSPSRTQPCVEPVCEVGGFVWAALGVSMHYEPDDLTLLLVASTFCPAPP